MFTCMAEALKVAAKTKAKEVKNLLSNSTDKFFVSFAPQYPRLKAAYKEVAEDLRPHGVHFYHVGPSFKAYKL